MPSQASCLQGGESSLLTLYLSYASHLQVYDLERKGGSIIGGVLALLRDRKANPPPPRDARLPPKPKGQTVGSFRQGLQMLPNAMAANMSDIIR